MRRPRGAGDKLMREVKDMTFAALRRRLPGVAFGAAMAIAAGTLVVQAQRGRPQQTRPGAGDADGRGDPNPLGQPLLDPAGFVRDAAMLKPPVLQPEDRKYADIQGSRMKQILMEVDAISLKDRESGRVFWG